MKTMNMLVFTMLCMVTACQPENKVNSQKVSFGIYEVIRISDLPAALLDTLRRLSVPPETDLEKTIGYIHDSDPVNVPQKLLMGGIQVMRTVYPADKDHRYVGLYALKSKPEIDNSDIQKTTHTGSTVEIHFSYAGAKKWADMTRKNKGNTVAMVYEGRIVSMPYINDEIRGGVALIRGLKDETAAKTIAASLGN